MADDVEECREYTKHVEELAQAWEFIFEYLDKVGPDPSVTIEPFYASFVDDDGSITHQGRKFSVCVSGCLSSDDSDASEGEP
jgi:hypothetical protein